MTRPSAPHVLVVGAGPAGSAAATLLARRGARVTMLEGGRFPRDKVCGDGLSAQSVAALDRLGYTPPRAECQSLSRLHVVGPSGYALDTPFPSDLGAGRAWVVPRAVLDEGLAQLAARAGAELREGFRAASLTRGEAGVRVTASDGASVDGDLVLGCDGYPSMVRRALGAPRFSDPHRVVAMRTYYEGVRPDQTDAFQIHWQRELLPGYGWIFPLPDGRANVGVGMRADLLARGSRSIRELMGIFCRSPVAARQIAGGRRVGKAKGHQLPLGSMLGRAAFDRALLLGDAAGLVNPTTGEGIEHALESGALAAAAVERAEAAGRFDAAALASYDQDCQRAFGDAFVLSSVIQGFVSAPRAVDIGLRFAGRFEAVNRVFFDLLGGGISRWRWRLAAKLVRAARRRGIGSGTGI